MIVVELTPHERDACDEMRGLLGLSSDADLMRAALYKLAAFLEPDIDCRLFALRGRHVEAGRSIRRGTKGRRHGEGGTRDAHDGACPPEAGPRPRSPEYEAGRELARQLVRVETQRDELLAVLAEIARLRLATNEGSLRVRADRIWELATKATRCDGRYPVPQTSPPRDEPFDVTYRCALPNGHDGPHGPQQEGA